MPEQTLTRDPRTPDGGAPERSRLSRLLLPGLVVLALVGLTAFFLLGRGDGGSTTDPSGSAQQGEAAVPSADSSQDEVAAYLESLARREEGDPMAVGDVDAPVVMINYSEFQCPFCGRFARETEPTLVEEYVESGDLRIEWRDFPYLGEESQTAARAGRAAAEQDGFWEFAEAMFADQQPPNSGRLTPEFLADVAEGVGLDREQFLADLESPELAEAVERDFSEGQAIGVTGTPAFLINGQPVIGAQPTDVFVETIEQALAEAEAGR